jgi:hypothetical protein
MFRNGNEFACTVRQLDSVHRRFQTYKHVYLNFLSAEGHFITTETARMRSFLLLSVKMRSLILLRSDSLTARAFVLSRHIRKQQPTHEMTEKLCEHFKWPIPASSPLNACTARFVDCNTDLDQSAPKHKGTRTGQYEHTARLLRGTGTGTMPECLAVRAGHS